MKKNKLKTIFFDILKIFKYSFSNFGSNRPVQLAGTTAYFAIFSIAPVLIIIISVFGYVSGNLAVRQNLFDELEVLIGEESSEFLMESIENYNIFENSLVGSIIGIVVFVISATALFSELQNSINYIWRVKVKTSLKLSLLNILRTRLFSFVVILGLGFLFLVSLIIDASIGFLKEFLIIRFSSHFIFLAQTVNLVISLGIITVLIAFVYRYLPDVHVNWSAAWFGAVITSALFIAGRFLIGMLISQSNLGVVYGAAGSFVVILVWVYIVSLIFYFGVELTHQFSLYYGHNNLPRNYAGTFEIHSVE
jgi:membrane protein